MNLIPNCSVCKRRANNAVSCIERCSPQCDRPQCRTVNCVECGRVQLPFTEVLMDRLLMCKRRCGEKFDYFFEQTVLHELTVCRLRNVKCLFDECGDMSKLIQESFMEHLSGVHGTKQATEYDQLAGSTFELRDDLIRVQQEAQFWFIDHHQNTYLVYLLVDNDSSVSVEVVRLTNGQPDREVHAVVSLIDIDGNCCLLTTDELNVVWKKGLRIRRMGDLQATHTNLKVNVIIRYEEVRNAVVNPECNPPDNEEGETKVDSDVCQTASSDASPLRKRKK